MNILTLAACAMAIASALLLYGLSYDTRGLEARVRAAERQADRARAEIGVLRAERAHLARPERIEPHARAAGLRPIERTQVETPPVSTHR
jgi:cell division protein FtsL